MLGVLVGAALTYWFQHRLLSSASRRTTLNEARRAQFAIASQLNFVVYVSRHLDKYRDHPNRGALIHTIAYEIARPMVDLGAMTFLLESTDPSLMMKLAVSQEDFQQLTGVIAERNRFYQGPLADFLGPLHAGGAPPPDDAWQLQKAKTLTDSLYESAESAMERATDCARELRDALKQMFPNEKFLAVRIPGESGEAAVKKPGDAGSRDSG